MATNFSNQSPADNCFGVPFDAAEFAAFVALGPADFVAAAGVAADFPFTLPLRFAVFFGEPMYLPWKRKSVANRRKNLAASHEDCYLCGLLRTLWGREFVIGVVRAHRCGRLHKALLRC